MKDLLGSRSPLGFLGSLLLVLPWRRGGLGCLDETAVWACFPFSAFLGTLFEHEIRRQDGSSAGKDDRHVAMSTDEIGTRYL